MNEQTEKNINEAIDWLQQVGGSVQDFAVEQAPLYCREVVAWELFGGVSLLVASLLIIALCIYGARWCYRIWDDPVKCPMVGLVAPLIIVGFAGACPLSIIGGNKAIKAAVAPRLVIVEHLRGLK